MKYRLPQQKMRQLKQVCIYCGKERIKLIPDTLLPNPNTTLSFYPNGVPFFQGTKLGCLLGNHKYYYDYELEVVE